MIDPRLQALLAKHEGLRLKPYRCTAGKLTIGYGRNLEDRGISRDEALMLLMNDIHSAESEAFAAFPWYAELDPVRRAVVVNMVFNLGLNGFRKFRGTIAAIEGKRFADASQQMLLSRWAEQVGPRAHELSRMMESGEWPA
jgi:lysozyme